MSGSRPVRALVLVLVGYATVRTMVVFAPGFRDGAPPAPAGRAPMAAAGGRGPAGPDRPVVAAGVAPPAGGPPLRTIADRSAPRAVAPPAGGAGPMIAAEAPSMLAATRTPPTSGTSVPAVDVAVPPVAAPAPTGKKASRWSGFAYAFGRSDRGGDGALAPAGQIGGSQLAARIAYRVTDAVAVAARIATPPAATAQAEVAAGVDLIPLPGLRVSIERRVAIGRRGRDAWSAYAAGGFFRTVAPRVQIDGYAQAGLVGARARDPFADGAVRIVHRTPIAGGTELHLGGGAWGAAQPGAARIDVGPRAALSGRLARLPVMLALEGRLRVAGRARPGDGVALTLATDF